MPTRFKYWRSVGMQNKLRTQDTEKPEWWNTSGFSRDRHKRCPIRSDATATSSGVGVSTTEADA